MVYRINDICCVGCVQFGNASACVQNCQLFKSVNEAQDFVMIKVATDPNTMGHFNTLCHDLERDLKNPNLWSASQFNPDPDIVASRVQKFKRDYCFDSPQYLGYRRYFVGSKTKLSAVAKAAGIRYLKHE